MSSFIDLRLNKLTWALPYKSKTNILSVEQGAVFMVLCLKQGQYLKASTAHLALPSSAS